MDHGSGHERTRLPQSHPPRVQVGSVPGGIGWGRCHADLYAVRPIASFLASTNSTAMGQRLEASELVPCYPSTPERTLEIYPSPFMRTGATPDQKMPRPLWVGGCEPLPKTSRNTAIHKQGGAKCGAGRGRWFRQTGRCIQRRCSWVIRWSGDIWAAQVYTICMLIWQSKRRFFRQRVDT